VAGENTGRGRRNTYAKFFDLSMDWLERAACGGASPAFDYDQALPRESARTYNPPKRVQEAQEVCRTECPVRAECLDFALRIEVPRGRVGVYGGLTPNERDEFYDQQKGRIA
jgi:transcription factor WhiB